MPSRRPLRTLVSVAAVALAALPAALVFGLGWLPLGHPAVPSGGVTPRDPSRPEWWALFALVYLVWMLGLMVAVIWCYDRLGANWRAWDRAPRPSKRRRRRLAAGLGYVAGQERARAQAEAGAAPPRPAGRPAAGGDPADATQEGASGDRPSGDRPAPGRPAPDRPSGGHSSRAGRA